MKYVIAHDDVDGLMSAAILERRERNECWFGDYADLKGLEEVLRELREKERGVLRVVDLCLSQKMGEKLGELFKEVAGRHETEWYDHHQGNRVEEVLKGCLRDYIIDTGEKAASWIVQKRFGRDDEYARRLAEMAEVSDQGREDSEDYKFVEKLDRIMRFGYDKRELVRELAEGKSWDEFWKDKERAHKYYWARERVLLLNLEDKIERYEIKGARVLVALAPKELYIKQSLNYLKGGHGVGEDWVILNFYEGKSNVCYYNGKEVRGMLKMAIDLGGGGRDIAGGFNIDEGANEENYGRLREEVLRMMERYL